MRRRGLEEEEKPGLTRRSFLRGAVIAGGAGFIGATGYGTIVSLIAPPDTSSGGMNNGFIYAAPQDPILPIWYEDLVGQEARIDHFEVGQGAALRWKSLTDEKGEITFPGFAAQLIRMDETTLELPEGFPKDEFLINGLFGLFNTCTHAGCPPGWQLLPPEKYVPPGIPEFPTIYCECHWSQYDPRRLAKYRHPPAPESTGVEYLGVYKIPGLGPADRGMPLIPLELEGTKIIGKVKNSDWYRYLTWRDTIIPEDE